MKINVGLAQISPKLADVRSNCELHMQFIERAAQQKVDLLVFPELSMTGYAVQDAVGEVAHRAVPSDPLINTMLEASQRMDLVGRADHDGVEALVIDRLAPIDIGLGLGELLGCGGQVTLVDVAQGDDVLAADRAHVGAAGAAVPPGVRPLRRLGIGGTATGTGLNAHPEYHARMVRRLTEISGLVLYTSDNLFESMQSMADPVDFSASLRTHWP